MTACPVMMVVRLPDSPTEYGRSVSLPDHGYLRKRDAQSFWADQTHGGFRSRADVGYADVNVKLALGIDADHGIAAAHGERNAMNPIPAPRLIGPRSEPGWGRQRFFQSNASAPRRPHCSSL